LIAPTNYSVIIYGESGTGKEVIAKAIHEAAVAKTDPFGAGLWHYFQGTGRQRTFGHMKGSFTGAQADKEGYLKWLTVGPCSSMKLPISHLIYRRRC